MQDQDEQQPEQEQVRYSAPEQVTGPDSTEQITGTGCRTDDRDQMMQQGQDQTRQRTGTEGYRTGYNAVHRSDTDTDADATGCRTRTGTDAQTRQQTDDRTIA